MSNNLVDKDSFGFVDITGTEARASSSRFGTVKLSDNYNANGYSANGLAPSQYALSAGLNRKLDVSSWTATNTISFRGIDINFYRYGKLICVCAYGALTEAIEAGENIDLGSPGANFYPLDSPIYLPVILPSTIRVFFQNTNKLRVVNESSSDLGVGHHIAITGIYPAFG